MAKSEFRYNKKRKHYSYIFKQRDNKYKNILLSTKPNVKEKHNKKIKMRKNIKLYHHPDINNQNDTYLINKVYEDYTNSFDKEKDWNWNINDKRKVKRIKNGKKV